MNKEEKCANCKYCKPLWWWVYKDNGLVDHKEHGHVCMYAEDDDWEYYAMKDTDGMCECFTPKE